MSHTKPRLLPTDPPQDGLADLRHELRTPMTALKGALDLLAGGALGPVPDAMAAPLADARQQAARLADRLENVLRPRTAGRRSAL